MGKKKYFIIFSITMFFILNACSSSSNCLRQENLKIEYYTAGGFTNISHGVTITTDGITTIWQGSLSTKREVQDSLYLSSDIKCKIDSMLSLPECFTYKNKFDGNMTAYLSLQSDNKTNEISFDPFNFPSNMPVVLKDLIEEIKQINSN